MSKAKTKLQVQQNGALRAVLRADSNIPSVELYLDANVDAVEVFIKKTTCKIVYYGINDVGPPVYNKLFNLICLIGNYVHHTSLMLLYQNAEQNAEQSLVNSI